MQQPMRLYRPLSVLFWLMTSGIVGNAVAHDVQKSEIRAIFGQGDRDGSIEIWQTMSVETAYRAARGSDKQNNAGADLRDSDVLEIIGQQLFIETTAGRCDLTKQAYRRVHQGMRLQMRYLFDCPENEQPTQMTFGWMSHTPRSHFAVLEQDSGQGSPFKVIEQGNPVIAFDHF